jgi:DNA polymerase-1
MLLKFGFEQKGSTATKKSQLTGASPAEVTSTVATVRRNRQPVDDSIIVAEKMKKLFSGYNWHVVTNELELIQYLSTRQDLGIDCETTGLNPFRDELVGFSLGTEKDCIYIPLKHHMGTNYKDDTRRITDLLKSHDLYGFNAKFDMKFLHIRAGIQYKVKWCGYIGARLMHSSEPVNGLKDLYTKYIDPNEPVYHFAELFANPFSFYDPAVVGGYAAVDAMKHIILGKWQESKMDGKVEKQIMYKLEVPLISCLQEMEETGIALDSEWCKQLTQQLEQELAKTRETLDAKYPGLNPSSPKQVAEWLYDKLGLPQINGRGTGEATLRELNSPVVDVILDYRKNQKLISTYAAKMPSIAVDGVVHCTYNQYGADTGRFSSEDPNLQNIPKDNRFRRMFVARPGKMLVSCDYSQQEVYTLAAMANDEEMKKAYASGMDFYAYMASIVFDVPYETCQKKQPNENLRNQMKSIVLGVNYDMGIWSLAKDIGKSVEETKEIYKKFFEKCPRIKEFRAKNLDFAIKNGYVQTILGRKRWLPMLSKPDFECSNQDVMNMLNKLRQPRAINQLIADAQKEGIEVVDNRRQKSYETRQVVNSIIQGSAADMTKLAIVAASNDQHLRQLGCKLLLQIHDEIIAEFPEENAEEGGRVLSQLMVDVGSDLIGIRMKCDPSVMKYWQKD